MTNIEIAMRYVAKGLSVIPLYSLEMVKTNPPKSYIESLDKSLRENSDKEGPLPKKVLIKSVNL